MANNTIDARLLAKMFLAGAKNLEAKKAWINELNVFPVPDGDTGTNMTMTIMSAAKEVTQADPSDMKAICKCISSGSLRGERKRRLTRRLSPAPLKKRWRRHIRLS